MKVNDDFPLAPKFCPKTGRQFSYEQRGRAHESALSNLARNASGSERDRLIAEMDLLEAKRKLRAHEKVSDFVAKNPGTTLFSVEGSKKRLAAASAHFLQVKDRVCSLLGIGQSEPAVAPPAPSVAAAPVRVTASSTPTEVASVVSGLLNIDVGAFKEGRADTNRVNAAIANMENLQKFIDDLAKVDPQGKSLERIDAGTSAERKEAARIIGGVLGNLPTAALPIGTTATSTASAAPAKPLFGLDRVQAAIKAQISKIR